jgi:peptide/nickel transport system ATP-binding protein
LRPEETLGRYPHQLSGGQRQRIMVARAVLLRPRVILADEPVSMVDASLRATILNSLLALNRDLGISIIYITHDLTTAFQISEDIIVLYRGVVAEAGEVGLVVQQPVHPYTQLLVGSIPEPDPDQPWQGERVLDRAASAVRLVPTGPSYCPFHDRCPHVMPMCVEQMPPLFRPDPFRVAACYLKRDAPAISSNEMTGILAEARAANGASRQTA